MQLALIADFDPAFPPHLATEAAVLHAAEALNIEARTQWIGTAELQSDAATRLREFAGVWIAPGSPYRSLAGVLAAIRHVREADVPLLGTCGGFQHVAIEYARNVLGFQDAAHAEYDPYASRLFISQLACSLVGQSMQVQLAAGSRAAEAYRGLSAREAYYCNFGINPALAEELFRGELVVSGTDCEGEPRVVELPGKRFFLATLFVPQVQSRATEPHPLVTAWLTAGCEV